MIRGITGFDLGMPTLSQDEVRVAAGHGPTVIINTSPLGCDALLVHPNCVEALSLPGLKYNDIEKYARGDRASPRLLACCGLSSPSQFSINWASLRHPRMAVGLVSAGF